MTDKKIEQINVALFDERFYKMDDKFYPSVTYLLGCVYPSGFGLQQWIGDVGNKRAEEIRDDAGEDGSFVHEAIEKILLGGKIHTDEINDRFKPQRSLKIHRCLKAFLDWYEEYKPETISTEYIVINDEYGYAGTVDYKCKIGGEEYIIDFKTSKSIHPTARVQLSAYNYADGATNLKPFILHLGNTTKKRYSFLEVDFERYFEEFKAAKKMFDLLHPNAGPNEETFPEYFRI